MAPEAALALYRLYYEKKTTRSNSASPYWHP